MSVNQRMTKSSPESENPPVRRRKLKKFVAKPDRYGVVQIPHDFLPAEDMAKDGTWVGWVKDE